MKNLLIILLFFSSACNESSQDNVETSFKGEDLYQLALMDLKAFAGKVTVDDETTYDQAKSIVTWYAKTSTGRLPTTKNVASRKF